MPVNWRNKPVYFYLMAGIFAVSASTMVCLITLGLVVLAAPQPQPTANNSPQSSITTIASTEMPVTPAITSTFAVDYGVLVDRPSFATMNVGLTFVTPDYVRGILGTPGDMTDTCSSITNKKLEPLMVTQDVGPNTVTGLKPAVEALQRVYAAVEQNNPDLYAQLAGQDIALAGVSMLCVRRVAGLNPANYSLHAWGIAVDVAINSKLDTPGDKKVQNGLVAIAPYFRAEGFYWGAAFTPSEDAMHFEVSRQLLDRWKNQGLLDVP